MAGYTPIFDTVFTGSLSGRYPDTAAWVFLLTIADKHGVVDHSPGYIANITGMPEGVLLECIERFMQPDPHSRTTYDEGRRLELLDPARPWGWRIINFAKYRERARKRTWDEERTASGLDAQRKREERAKNSDVPTSPDASRQSLPSNANPESKPSLLGATRPTDVEFKEIQRVYPKRHGSQRWADARKAIRARLREGHEIDELLEGTRRYAEFCQQEGKTGSQFVMQASTFFGANKAFRDGWELSKSHGNGAESIQAAATRLGIDRRADETEESFRRRVANALTAEMYPSARGGTR